MKSPPGANQADAAVSNRSFIHANLLSISARAQYRGRAASLHPYIDTLRRRREPASGPRLVRGPKPRGTRKYSSRSVFFPCKKAPRASAVFSCTSRDDATPHCMCCISAEHVGVSRRDVSSYISSNPMPAIRHFRWKSSLKSLPLFVQMGS